MATIRWYLVNGVDANGWQQLSETAQAAATCNAGWVVSTGSTSNSELQANTERAATTFVGTGPPDGTLDTSIKDAFRTPVLNGTFTSANWSFQFAVQSPTQGGAADGQIVFRMIKANADGSSATEITSAQQPASLCSNVSTSDVNGVLTINPGSITLTNQYLFIQVAWKRTGAGGMTTTNIRLRTGASTSVGTWILSSDFTPATQSVTTNLISSTATLYAPYLAGGPVPLPIAYWPFDEATGTTIADKSGNGHTATFQQALWRTLAQKFGASAIGWAGVPGVIANFTAINLGTVHSIAFWVSEYVTTNPGLIMGGAIDNEAPYFNDTILAYSTPGTGGPFFTTQNHGGLTGVHHIVVTRSGVSVRFYKDGVSLGTPTDLANGTNAVTVDTIGGANYSADATAQITIDELRLYNVALTPAEVFWLYNTTVINGPTPVASTASLFVPTVSTGSTTQAITAGNCAATSAVFAPTVAPGAVTVVGGTISSGIVRYRTPFTVQASQISGTLTNFPTYVNQTAVRFKSIANGGHVVSALGYDLIPYSDSACTTKLDFERLFYDPATGQVEDFVRVPSAAVGSIIYYGYGDANIVTDQSTRTAVWSNAGASGVWHLVKGGALNGNDATSNANNGTITGASVSGAGALFNGTSGNVVIPDSSVLKPTTGSFSISGVIRLLPTQSVPKAVFCTYNQLSSAIAGISFGLDIFASSPHVLAIVLGNNTASFAGYKGTTTVDNNTPHWFTIVGTGSALRIYVDGGADESILAQGSGYVQPVYRSPNYVRIASEATDFTTPAGEGKFFPGSLAEIHMYNGVALTQAWAAAVYLNQSNQATFFGTIQSEVVLSSSGASVNAPTVAAGVTTAFISSSQELRVVDTFDMVSIGPYLAPVGIFPPTVFGFPTQPVTGVHISSTLSLLSPAVYFPGTLPDPIAYWPFDENTGTIAIDQTGNGHTATIQQAVWDAFRRKFGASALGWLGTAGVMADITPINIGTVHTVTVWINGYTTANPGVILGGGTDTEILYISSTLFGYLTPGGYFTTIAHGDLSDGLHHLAVTRNGAVVRFYVDGVSLGTPTDLANGTVAQIVDTIGGVSFSPDATAQLTMDDLRIYGSAFTAEQILQLYNTQVLSGPTRVSELTFYGPTVANAAGSTSVTGVTISSGNQRFAPTVTVGAVTVVGGTIAVASQVFAPSTVTPGAVTIVGGTIATGNQRFAPTIATGPVTVILSTISAGSQVFTPSPITPGAVTVVGATRATTSQVFAPTLTAIATGATITSGSVVFAPAVSYAVSLGTRATTSQVFAPTLAYGLINGTVGVGSNAQFFAPSITVGAVTVVGGTRASTLQIFAPTVTTGPVTVVGGTITTTLQTFSPTVAVGVVTVVGGIVASTLQIFQPSVTALAAGSLGGQNIPTTVVMSPPTVALAVFFVTGATIPSTAVLQAPSVALGITAGHRASTAALTPPSVLAISAVTGGTRLSSLQLNAPSVTTLTLVTGATISAGTILLPPFMVSVVLTGATITTTAQLFAPTVSPAQFVTGAFISPGQVFAPSVSTLTAVTAGNRPSGLVLFPPSVQVISVITTPGRSSTLQIFAPTLTATVTGAFIGSTAQVFAPTIPSGVVGMSIGSTIQLFAPSVAIGVVGATIGSTGQLFVPAVALRVTGAFIGATGQVFGPAFVGGSLIGASITSTLQVFPPTLAASIQLGFLAPVTLLTGPSVAPVMGVITVGGISPTTQLFPPTIARVWPPTTCVASQITVQYLVTSVTLECATAAVGLVSVRYLVSSDGVNVCCAEKRVTCESF